MKALWPSLALRARSGAQPASWGLLAPVLVLLPSMAFAEVEVPPNAPGMEPAPIPDPAAPPAEPPLPAPAAPLAPASGMAEPLGESPLVRPKIDIQAPEPTPSVTRKARNHEGFYLRVSAGAGYRSSAVSSDAATHPGYTVNGAGISLDLLVGGSPSPGLAIGGGLLLDSVSDGEVHLESGRDVGSGTGGLLLLGPFVDGFPMNNGGFHLGGLVGLAGAAASREGETDEFSGGGLGGAVWIGQGFWVSDEWSLGGDLRLNGAFLRDSGGEVELKDSVFGASLVFSALYH